MDDKGSPSTGGSLPPGIPAPSPPPISPAQASSSEAASPGPKNVASEPPPAHPPPARHAARSDDLPQAKQNPKSSSFWSITFGDIINIGMLAAVAASFWVAREQGLTTSNQLTYTALLQLKKDTDDVNQLLSKPNAALPDLRAVCDIPPNSDKFKAAAADTDKILDYYEFYYRSRYEYPLLTEPVWKQICDSSRAVAASNCFISHNISALLSKRADDGFKTKMSMCLG